MGLLDYYRQFEDIDEEELNKARRERVRREKELALQQLPDIDLSGTEWPEFPNSEVMNASIYTAKGRINGYPDRHAEGIRRSLAELHGVEPERIVLGNGAAELLQAAALTLLSAGDELLMPWPSYPLYPLMATRAGGRPIPVDGVEELAGAVGDRTRALVICNPNDPTGSYLPADVLGAVLSGLPDHVTVLLDEALVHFQDVEPTDACLRLTDAFPRLLVIRTFSKVYGLSGLRAGYAVGATGEGHLLDAVAPVLGVNALTQSAIEHALKIGGAEVERRRQSVIREREALQEALRGLPVTATDSQANFVWLTADGMSGGELAEALSKDGVFVAPGRPLGADDHVRITVRDAKSTARLLSALTRALRAD